VNFGEVLKRLFSDIKAEFEVSLNDFFNKSELSIFSILFLKDNFSKPNPSICCSPKTGQKNG
jgi:hypothetical protein